MACLSKGTSRKLRLITLGRHEGGSGKQHDSLDRLQYFSPYLVLSRNSEPPVLLKCYLLPVFFNLATAILSFPESFLHRPPSAPPFNISTLQSSIIGPLCVLYSLSDPIIENQRLQNARLQSGICLMPYCPIWTCASRDSIGCPPRHSNSTHLIQGLAFLSPDLLHFLVFSFLTCGARSQPHI